MSVDASILLYVTPPASPIGRWFAVLRPSKPRPPRLWLLPVRLNAMLPPPPPPPPLPLLRLLRLLLAAGPPDPIVSVEAPRLSG